MSVSTDGGVTWVLIRRLAASGLNQWREYPFTLGPFDITLTSQMRFRFSAEDGGADTTVDCAMDDFSVRALAAEPTAVASTAPTRRATKLHPSQPNPFSSQTEIRYGLAGRAPVRIAVFDVGGRELCVLADAVGEPGEHVVTWDGRDAAGRLVPSGVYFCRLSTASYEHSQRIVLVR